MIFLLLYCSTSPQVPVHYNAGQDGNVVLGNRCSNSPVYEDIDAYRVGFNNQGIPSGVLDQGGVNWCDALGCGVVLCGALRCGVVWCGALGCGVVWCGALGCGVVP